MTDPHFMSRKYGGVELGAWIIVVIPWLIGVIWILHYAVKGVASWL